MTLGICILAAGQSRRLKTQESKLFTVLGGQSVIAYVYEVSCRLNPEALVIITSATHKQRMMDACPKAKVVVQDTAQGTGDALQYLLPEWSQAQQWLVVCGDTPLLQQDTLQTLKDSPAEACFLSMVPRSPHHRYGRLTVTDAKQVTAIVEAKDSRWAKASSYAYAGAMMLRGPRAYDAIQALPHYKRDQSTEVYATHVAEIIHKAEGSTSMILGPEEECWGINTLQDYTQVLEALQQRWKTAAMDQGVKFYGASTTYLSYDTVLHPNVEVHPHVVFGPGVCVQAHSRILPFTFIQGAHIQEYSTVGPFAHVHDDVIMKPKGYVGNFVEVKRSTLGANIKAKHLSYIGDATVEDNVNIGAGVITCNYDGTQKHKTHIGENAFVGSLSALIAPLQVGAGARIAAGTVVRSAAPAYALTYNVKTQKSR